MRAFRLAYDGRPFRGFQRQPDVPTVEDALLDALAALDVVSPGEVPPNYAAAGRTDADVSAVAQTVAFAAPDWLTPAALNGELPDPIRAWAHADVPADFHATHDATARAYEYHLHAPADAGGNATGTARERASAADDVGTTVGESAAPIDERRVRATLDRLAGEHDFHNLTPDADGTIRELTTDCRREGDFLVCRFRADGFPRHLVRRLVGLATAVGRGTASMDDVERHLAAEPIPGHRAAATAPAEPLVLAAVAYDVDFAVDADAAADAGGCFERTRVERATGARVAGALRDGVREE